MDPVVVVGGGIVGASVTHHLRRADVPVVLYERDALGGGTTADSAAMFVWKAAPARPGAPDGTAHRLRARSWETYERLVDEGTVEFSRVGGLYPAESAGRLDRLRAAAERLGGFGVGTEVLDADGLERFGLVADGLIGGLYVPDEGYLDPGEIVQFLASEARAAGARVETGAAVTDVFVEEDRAVGIEVDGERVPASGIVNAAGPWAPSVDAMAGVSLPLRHNRGPILVLDHDADRTLPFVEFEDGHYVRGEGRRQVFAGRYGAGYDAAGRLDLDAARAADEGFRLAVGDLFERYLPSLVDARVRTDWVGVRTITPDGRPFVGVTGLDGYYAATGMNGLGVTLAPAAGEHLASVVAADRDPEPAFRTYLSPSRVE
ncbi:MAG: FAD-dependent oxidoreductase [Haloarculaceae archaeon]